MFRDVDTFVMRGDANTDEFRYEVVCTTGAGIAFFNISTVSITNIAFLSCGNTSIDDQTYALLVSSVAMFVLEKSLVSNSSASSLFIVNSEAVSTGNVFIYNSAVNYGGGIYISDSSVNITDSRFFVNFALIGGAVYISDYSIVVFSGINIFANNEADGGGAVYVNKSTISFNGNNTFLRNKCLSYGAAIMTFYASLYFTKNVTIVENSGVSILWIAYSALEFSGANIAVVRNGPAYATMHIVENSTLNVKGGRIIFDRNFASESSVLLIIESSNVAINATAEFTNNWSPRQFNVDNGTLIFCGKSLFFNNTATGRATGIVYAVFSTLRFLGETNFTRNKGRRGGAIYVHQTDTYFAGSQVFEHNKASVVAGAIHLSDCTVSLVGNSTFLNNSGGDMGGAISGANGKLYLDGNSTFIGNQAQLGGAIYFAFNSRMLAADLSTLLFESNRAEKGGAIYISDTTGAVLCLSDPILSLSIDLSGCFIRTYPYADNIRMILENNTASIGDNIFGGLLDRCIPNDDRLTQEHGISLLKKIVQSKNGEPDFNLSTISSDPLHICFCKNGIPDCSNTTIPEFRTARGGTVTVSAVAVDQVNSTVPAIIRGEYPDIIGKTGDFGQGQRVQEVQASCISLNYTILTLSPSADFYLYAQGPCADKKLSRRQIIVHLDPCPVAFELSNSECICAKRLQPFTNSCSVDSASFRRRSNFWIGKDYANGTYKGLVTLSHCPFDYCIGSDADISVDNLDSQCNYNRSGILCGSCKQNLSLLLGSSRCLECSNVYLVLLLPFAAAGVILVFFLFLLRLTVSIGTLSGLIFYANILTVNKAIFFPPGDTNVLTIFVAWLNLDFGIETCFYSGMDVYGRLWLQYIFPAYIWLLVVLIIVGSRYIAKFPRLFGRNPVSVLATLFLLSYAKLLRTIIASFSAAILDYPDNLTNIVWFQDGNVGYLRGKHIPLFLVSLLFLVFFFLPYTFFLFLGQWLLALSDRKALFWMSNLRVKIFLDAHYAPYKVKHRYWPGFLLLLRWVLFLVFTFNATGDPSINLLAISSIALGLAIMVHFTGPVYTNKFISAIESSFILNLGVLSLATHYVLNSGGNQKAVTYIFVGVAFVEFLGIVLYHAYLQINDTATWKSLVYTVKSRTRCSVDDKSPVDIDHESSTSTAAIQVPSSSLLNFTELREPLLEDSI